MTHLLILAGSGEARRLVPRLSGRDGLRVTVSYFRNPQLEQAPGVALRVGGFGGDDGFRTFVDRERVDAVLDATHPFATRITARTACICKALSLPHLYLLRPAWAPDMDDNWTLVENAEAAARLIRPDERLFVASGRGTLEPLRHSGARIFCRRLSPPDEPFPFDGGEFLFGLPPFSVEEEVALFRDKQIERIMVKNAGGTASFSKLEAARLLHLPVLMLTRPAPPDCAIVDTIEKAETWATTL
ncbi:MAG: precorrin-6A/cobalt-precorrin-6A reductase [Brevirhabdus sp.]